MTKLIRRPIVEQRTGLARSTIYDMMKDGRFPRAVRIGDRAVAWPEIEVDAWIEARLAERGEVSS